MQQVVRARVASHDVVQCGAPRFHRTRQRKTLSIRNSLVRPDDAPEAASTEQQHMVSSHLSSGHQQLARSCSSTATSCEQHQQQSSDHSWMVLPMVAMHQICTSFLMQAHAAEGVSPAAIILFREFLDQIEALGPWGGALFVITVMCAEMVPLFPTQPLTLASGLLFGPIKGAIFVVLGVTLAAANAFTLARGVGRKLAEKVIAHEVGDSSSGGPVAQQLASVSKAIESGGFLQQVTAITLLRLTPVVPFSASNYLLGLTPVQFVPMLIGTVTGMSVWSILYASLGGASRKLLDGGAELDVLLEDLADKAGQYSQDVAVLGLILGVAAGGYYLLSQKGQAPIAQSSSSSSNSNNLHQQHPLPPPLDAARAPEEVLQQK